RRLLHVPMLCFTSCTGDRRDLPSFPTRRSSDLHLLLVEKPFESLSAVGRGYIGVLRRLIEHPGKVLLAGTAFLVGVYAAYAAFGDRKSTRLNSSHVKISYAVFCLKKKINRDTIF